MSTSTIHPSIVDLLRFTRTHQRHHEALMRATGGHFNLFQVLGIGHYEVKTHSPILAELLNPKGRHGQGAVFLDLFLTKLDIDKTAFNPVSTRVETERYIGPKTETTGGRIDIVVEDGIRRRILIENKINADDQENQLLRYHNYDRNADLIYLTLFRSEASFYSAGGLSENAYRRFSYEKEIRDWLIECRKEAACLPGVREMISQYIHLIKELTDQSTTMQMNQELIEEITGSEESLRAFFALMRVQADVKPVLLKLLDKQLDQVAKKLSLKREGHFDLMNYAEATFGFTNDDLKALEISIMFQFAKRSHQELFFGFSSGTPSTKVQVMTSLNQAFADVFGVCLESPIWPAYACFEAPYCYWNDETFEHIISGDLAKSIEDKLEKLTKIARRVYDTQPSGQPDTDHSEP